MQIQAQSTVRDGNQMDIDVLPERSELQGLGKIGILGKINTLGNIMGYCHEMVLASTKPMAKPNSVINSAIETMNSVMEGAL